MSDQQWEFMDDVHITSDPTGMKYDEHLEPETHAMLARMNRAGRRALGYHPRRYTRPVLSPRRTNRLYVLQKMYQAMLTELED